MAEVYENYFFTWHLTDEDKAKTMQYQQERERRKERESAVSYEDYLRSLQTTIRLAPVNDNTRERAVQLMNKTNQLIPVHCGWMNWHWSITLVRREVIC